MDRIKMRAWHKEQKKMYEVESICPYEDDRTKGGEVFLKGIEMIYFYFPEEVEVMFSTGKRDVNKDLIFEGDIVDKLCELDETGIIRWDNEEAKYVIDDEINRYQSSFENYYGEDLEILGNIYENPELHEVKNEVGD